MPLVLVKAVNGRQHPFQKQTAGNRLRRTALSQGGEKLLAEQATRPMVCRRTLASQIDLLPTEWAHLQRCHSPSGRRSHTLCPSRGAVGVLLDEWPRVITADHTVVGGRQGPAGCSLRRGASRGLAPGRDGCMHPEHQAAVAQGPPAGGQGLLGAGLVGRRRRGRGRRRPPAVAAPGAALRSSAAQGPQVARGARGAVHYHAVRWHVVPVVTHGNRIRWRGLSEPEVWGCTVRKQWR